MKKSTKKVINTMRLEIASISANESFARTTVAAFASQLDPKLDDINDLKTAVSEAVTNCVVHSKTKTILIEATLYEAGISVTITDFGIGISNIEKAMEPFYTTKPDEERSGMGFTVMEEFMDDLEVHSKPGEGTVVKMRKEIS